MFESVFSSSLILWVVVMAVAVVIEAASVQLMTIWFAIGAFCAIIAEAVSAPFYIQVFIFFFVSVVLLVFTRPILQKLMKKKTDISVNSDIGKTGTVTRTIDPAENEGRVILGDVSWNAKTKGADIIPVNSKVRVEEVDGTTLYVKKIN